MEKLLHTLKTFFNRKLRSLSTAVLLIAGLGLSNNSNAQVYWSTNDANVNATADDAYYKMNYDGSNKTTISSGLINLAIGFAIDGNNNRMFVYEAKPGSYAIKILNLTTGALINTIPVSYEIRDMEYDPRTDYLYYTTEGGNGAALSEGDAVNRVHGDGTGQEVFLSSVCLNPYRLELDMAHNRLIIFQSNFAQRRMYFVDMPTKAVTFRAFAGSLNTVWDIAYDEDNDYIYYTVENGNGGIISGNDQLRRQKSDGTGDVVLISSFLNSPYRIALDRGNNRAFINDSYYAAAKIVSVNLTDNTYATVRTGVQTQNGPVIVQINVPRPPTVTTTAASSISSASATLAGSLVYGYGLNTERGIVYSTTNATPTVSDSKTVMTTSTGNGAYSASVTGLSPSTSYYARAYAVNGAGTTYGAVITFTTASNDNNLSAFAISSGTLTPAFSAATVTYAATVTSATSSITITPTKNDANASITVKGTAVTSGTGASVTLVTGDNVIPTVVTAQDGSTKTYNLTVTRDKAAQTITFNTLPVKNYGSADFSPGAAASSGLGVSYASNNSAVATIVNGNIHITGAGTATITASQAGDANNQAATDATQTLTVSAAPITVIANAATKVYGNADPALTYAVTSGALITGDAFTGALTRDGAGTATDAISTKIGDYSITKGTLALSTNYQLTFVSNKLTVTKRPLIIAPIAATKVYGNPDTGFPYSFNGTSYASTDAMTGVFGRPTGENVGTYALTIGNKRPVSITTFEDMSSNYDITFISNNLTITKRPLIFHPVPATKVYGNADPTYPYMLDGTSVAPDEGITGTFGRAAGEDVGTYALTLGTKRPVNIYTGVFTIDNYTISFVSDNLTITPRTLNIYANAQSKDYGDTDPVLTTYIQGSLREGDALTGALVRAAGENAGTYAITKGTLALNSNYSYTFTGESLTINKKTINVSANAKSKTYGDADPALDYTHSDLISGDTFTGALTRAAGENFGTYAISQGTLALSNNYTLNFTGADLSIGRKTIHVNSTAKSKTYGDADPALTYTADALANGESFTGALTRQAGENAGTYAITQGTLALNSNYDVAYTSDNLTINKATLAYLANPATRYFGDPNPAFSGTVTGFINGDTEAAATNGTLNFTTPATASSNIGSYAINGSGLTAANYNFVQAPANSTAFTITRSGDATLAALSVAQGTFDVPFSAGNLAYHLNVAHEVASLNLSATLNSAYATASVNGAPFTSGSTKTLALAAGYNSFTVAITAQDGSVKNYVVSVSRALSANNALSSISLSGVTFTPAFNNNILSYTATVPNEVLSTTVYGIPVDTTATVIPSQSSPYNFPLQVGENIVGVTSRAQNGDTRDFRITVIRAASSDATLASIGNSTIILNTLFTPGTHNYNTTVSEYTENISFLPVPSNDRAIVKVNGNDLNIYAGNPVQLSFGNNNVNISVTSQDGSSTINYVVNVIRKRSSDATLSYIRIPSEGTINEEFDAERFDYTGTVPDSNYTGLRLTIYRANTGATVKVNGVAVADPINYFMALHGGENKFKIDVTSQDSSATKTYNLIVTRAGQAPPLLSPNAALFSLSVSGNGGFSANFNFAYQTLEPLTVANTVSSVNLFLYAENAGAKATVNGTVVPGSNQEYYLSPVNLAVGDNLLNVIVTAEDGVATRTYPIHITRLPYVNVDLASLAVSNGTLTPAFAAGTTTYNLKIANNLTTLGITPVASGPGVTIQVGGITVDAANPTATVNVSPGLPNRIRTVVTAADGITKKTYTIAVAYATDNATLASLQLIEGALSPAFAADKESYTASVIGSVDSVHIKPVSTDANATVTVNGITPDGSTGIVALPLSYGSNQIVTTVISQDGTVTKMYTVAVTRVVSTNAYLKQLSLTGIQLTRIGSTNDYTASISPLQMSVQQTAIPTDTTATLKMNGQTAVSGTPITLALNASGPTVLTTVVTAQDGITKRIYTVTINKNGSANASLNRFTLIGIPLTRVGTTDSYTATATGSQFNVQEIAGSIDTNSTIKINGITTASGVASASIALHTGANVITTLVTAEDGITTRTYTITVTKAPSNVAALSQLSIPVTKLIRIGTTDNYTATVSSTFSSVQQLAITGEPNATLKVNGQTAISGTPLTVALNATGSTTLTTVVTAEDDTTTRTYTIKITRAPSDVAALAKLSLPGITLARIGTTDNYTASVSASLNSLQQLTVTGDINATFKVNGQTGISGTPLTVALNFTGSTTLTTVVTAEDNITTRTYTITVNKTGSNIAALTRLSLLGYSLTRVGTTDNYTTTAALATTSAQQIATTGDANATLKVNGQTAISGTALTVALNATGATTLTTVVTAENGTTTRTFTITVNKPAPTFTAAVVDNKIAITKDGMLEDKPRTVPETEQEINVHQGVSPNGDGINDKFTIDGIGQYPENTVNVMNRNGEVIYQVKGYDNYIKAFDGHDAKGTQLQGGTYFYSLEYKKGSETIRKTGYLVIKY